MFKVNNKDTRTTPPFSSVSIFNFEQVNVSWVYAVKQLFISRLPRALKVKTLLHLILSVFSRNARKYGLE